MSETNNGERPEAAFEPRSPPPFWRMATWVQENLEEWWQDYDDRAASKRRWHLLWGALATMTVLSVWNARGDGRGDTNLVASRHASSNSRHHPRDDKDNPATAPTLLANASQAAAAAAADSSSSSSSCHADYHRVMSKFESKFHLSPHVLERSRTYLGNRERLGRLTRKLQRQQEPVNVVVCGGSITVGHGVEKRHRYSQQLQNWLNEQYPLLPKSSKYPRPKPPKKHTVLNNGAHGADMCAMAKRLNFINVGGDNDQPPDLFVLEFAVNDYQGQDHKLYLDHKTDVFFDGFQSLALCAEVVVYRLLTDYPNAAVVFLEFRTAIVQRKTSQLLHLGAAQHYQVPVISYANALFPEYFKLMELLAPYNYSIPPAKAAAATAAVELPPFPHGCSSECRTQDLTLQFRERGCKSFCDFMVFSERQQPFLKHHQFPCRGISETPCYIPFFAHDPIHPSAVGHEIAANLLADFLAETQRVQCLHQQQQAQSNDNAQISTTAAAFAPHVLPTHSGWMVAGPHFGDTLRAHSDFVLVQDTFHVFGNSHPLIATNHSAGFDLPNKGTSAADRKGWIATNPQGGEYVAFDIQLPTAPCYDIIVSALRSYETVGTFNASVTDLRTQQTTHAPQTFDCEWKPRISVPQDFLITPSPTQTTTTTRAACTGHCRVTITTNPQVPGRTANQIKIMSLAVRKCVV